MRSALSIHFELHKILCCNYSHYVVQQISETYSSSKTETMEQFPIAPSPQSLATTICSLLL